MQGVQDGSKADYSEKCDCWIRLLQSWLSTAKCKCLKHFVGGNGPTEEHPDPTPATAVPEHVWSLICYVLPAFSFSVRNQLKHLFQSAHTSSSHKALNSTDVSPEAQRMRVIGRIIFLIHITIMDSPFGVV